MQTVLIVIHLMIVLALVVSVLLQRSEGGALGIGGGGFMSGRSQSNPLSRLTAYLAAGFFATSLALTILAGYGGGSVFDRLEPNSTAPQPAGGAGGPQAPLGSGKGGILPSLKPAGGDQKGQGAGAPPQPEAGSPPQPQEGPQPQFDAPPSAPEAPANAPAQGSGESQPTQPPAADGAKPQEPKADDAPKPDDAPKASDAPKGDDASKPAPDAPKQ